MPQLQNLVLADRTSPTPVNHTFTPVGINQQGVGEVANISGVPVGYERVTVSMKKTNTRYRGQVRLTIPVVQTETINGIDRPVVVRTAYVDMNFSFDETSTEQERKNAIGMAADSLGASKVLINDSLVKLESVY